MGETFKKSFVAFSLCVAMSSCDIARARELFPSSSSSDDPIEPFTVFGTIEKLFEVRVMDDANGGTKIIGRKRGITAKACTNVIPASRIPARGWPEVVGEIKETKDMLRACAPACSKSCGRAVGEYANAQERGTGFGLPKEARQKVLKSCTVTCGKDCERAGKSYSYEIPFRF
ncbi:unnamed product [Ostreococcus tauri]|uniref:Unnamed product n=1 Tax=Ostreococcus tauri TaxID=70448 RepID=A0A090M8A1_OSTTA|nr:unnamed product [Ostreococcus tauri]CEF98354.1 unnamed product [Ostreococcus tauri]|eukprot:XP_022839223.1 unnamed product [Ostreococcus tauri]